MKKILSSLLCVGFLSTFANANMISVDSSFASNKDEADMSMEKDRITFWNVKAQKYKTSDDDIPFVGALRVGGQHFSSNVLELDTNDEYKLTFKYVDYDALIGYGFYTQKDIHKTSINLLAGFHGKRYSRVDDEGKNKINVGGMKFGVSTLTVFQNELVFNVDVFARKYFNGKSRLEKKDRRMKVEADAMLGYKFGKDNDGLVVGLKGGYHDDIIGKGEHFGVSLGYIF